jgi:preprotein translocase subunit SecG
MAILLSILIILTCTILILAVLVQNPKGGGLASGFSSGAQVMGVRRTADFLEKATWTLAVLLMVFSIATASPSGKSTGGTDGTSETKDKASEFDANSKATPATNTSPFGAPQTPGGAPAGTPQTK